MAEASSQPGVIDIVIPVYNERDNIGPTLMEINEKVRSPHVINIVYDFDEDNTLPFVKRFMELQDNIYLIKNKYGRGALNAIKTGFECSEKAAVLVTMADLADEISIVDEMFQKINEGYDLVCGSRYMKGGKQIGGPLLKKTLSRLAGLSLYHLTGLPTRDATNSFKMYTRGLLNDISIESSGGFELGMEIVVKAYKKGYKITEVPTVWSDRTTGGSKFKMWAWLPRYLRWYFYALFESQSYPGRNR